MKRETLAGVRVVRWATGAEMASLFGITPRWLLELEERGLPFRGIRTAKRFPIPHAVVWWLVYSARRAGRQDAAYLALPVAFAEYRLDLAELAARHEARTPQQGALERAEK